MSNLESKMFEIFLSDQLFCSLYSALNFMEEKYQAPSPINIWMESLQIMQKIGNISRVDLIIGRMFAEKSQIEALCEEAVVFYMHMAAGREESQKPTALKDALARLLIAHGELWNTLYMEIRKSEQGEESKGYFITPCDYGNKVNQIVSLVKEELDSIKENNLDLEQAKKVVKSIVDNCMGLTGSAIESILLPLMTTNEEYDFAFDKDINRLKEKLGIKTQTNFHFDKLNDIHDNDQVQIGR